jgi:hypothetical protein
MPYESPEAKRKRIEEAMAASITQPALPPPNPNLPEAPQPIASEPGKSTNTEPQNVRVGFSAKGLSGLDRDMLKKRALEESDPSSRVKAEDEFVNIEPPKKMGRLKGLGLGILTGLAHGDPNNPNNILGSAIGGGALGAVKPHGVQEILRKDELAQTNSDIDRGLKQEEEKARLTGMQLKPQIDAAELAQKSQYDIERLNIERAKAAGLIGEQEARRQEREADRRERERHNKELERHNLATEDIQRNPPSREKSDTSEFTNVQVSQNIREAESERNKIGEYLKSIPRTVPTNTTGVDAPNPEYMDQMKRYRELDDQIRGWRLKQKPTNAVGRSGKKWSLSQWQKNNPDKDTEAAKKAAAAKGYVVTE